MDLKALAAFAEAYVEAKSHERYVSLLAPSARKLTAAYLKLDRLATIGAPPSLERYVLAVAMAKGAAEEDTYAVNTLIDNAATAFARELFAMTRQEVLPMPAPAPEAEAATPRNDAPAAQEGPAV